MKRFLLPVLLSILSLPFELHAGAWTLRKGTIYAKASFFASQTRHTFNSTGDRVLFLFNGKSRIYGTNLEFSYGLLDDLTLYVNIPYIVYRLGDDRIREEGEGFGDVLGSVKFNILAKPLVTSFEFQVKFPTAETFDPTRVLVGEGQYDFDFIAEFGYLWRQTSTYWNVEAGYRYRARNEAREFKPGDEIIYRLETGYFISHKLTVSALINGFTGTRTEILGLRLQNTQRNQVSITPSLTYQFNQSLALRVDYGLPIDGRNFYAGRVLTVGISFTTAPKDNILPKINIPSVRGVTCCTTQ